MFRCSAGNQALARRLAAGLDMNQGRATNIHTGDRIFIDLDGGAKEGPYDYVVVAVPSVAMEKITIDGKPFPYRAIAHGPAVKYLSAVERRFWISEGVAPSGMSDNLGMMWEGTDNQMDTAPFDVSVFAGGRPAQHAIDAGGGAPYFAPRLTALLPHYNATHAEFENWPKRIGMGYSCPARGEVTTKQKAYTDSSPAASPSPASTRRRAGSASWKARSNRASWRWRASRRMRGCTSRRSTANSRRSNEMIIRVATPADAATLAALSLKTFVDTFAPHNNTADMDSYTSVRVHEKHSSGARSKRKARHAPRRRERRRDRVRADPAHAAARRMATSKSPAFTSISRITAAASPRR